MWFTARSVGADALISRAGYTVFYLFAWANPKKIAVSRGSIWGSAPTKRKLNQHQ